MSKTLEASVHFNNDSHLWYCKENVPRPQPMITNQIYRYNGTHDQSYCSCFWTWKKQPCSKRTLPLITPKVLLLGPVIVTVVKKHFGIPILVSESVPVLPKTSLSLVFASEDVLDITLIKSIVRMSRQLKNVDSMECVFAKMIPYRFFIT